MKIVGGFVSEACKFMQVVNAELLQNPATWNYVALSTCRTRSLKKSKEDFFG